MIISKLKKENIFCDEYSNLISHNIIDIEHNKIAVIYGPNGTGKSSLASILNNETGTEYTISYGNKIYSETNHLPIHVIQDQNGRNIDKGLFLKTYTNKPITEDIDINKDKLSFILDDLKNKNSCIQNLLNIEEDNLNQDLNYQKVEETTDALYILKKYNTSTNCIVCDHDIHYQKNHF